MLEFCAYLTPTVIVRIIALCDSEIDDRGWSQRKEIHGAAQDVRDRELMLDLTGNLDAPV